MSRWLKEPLPRRSAGAAPSICSIRWRGNRLSAMPSPKSKAELMGEHRRLAYRDGCADLPRRRSRGNRRQAHRRPLEREGYRDDLCVADPCHGLFGDDRSSQRRRSAIEPFPDAIDFPRRTWAKAQRETVSSLAVGWDAEPAGRISIDVGPRWSKAATTAVLGVLTDRRTC